jgi:hypothetical protein
MSALDRGPSPLQLQTWRSLVTSVPTPGVRVTSRARLTWCARCGGRVLVAWDDWPEGDLARVDVQGLTTQGEHEALRQGRATYRLMGLTRAGMELDRREIHELIHVAPGSRDVLGQIVRVVAQHVCAAPLPTWCLVDDGG